jgi:hypothetical protein
MMTVIDTLESENGSGFSPSTSNRRAFHKLLVGNGGQRVNLCSSYRRILHTLRLIGIPVSRFFSGGSIRDFTRTTQFSLAKIIRWVRSIGSLSQRRAAVYRDEECQAVRLSAVCCHLDGLISTDFYGKTMETLRFIAQAHTCPLVAIAPIDAVSAQATAIPVNGIWAKTVVVKIVSIAINALIAISVPITIAAWKTVAKPLP